MHKYALPLPIMHKICILVINLPTQGVNGGVVPWVGLPSQISETRKKAPNLFRKLGAASDHGRRLPQKPSIHAGLRITGNRGNRFSYKLFPYVFCRSYIENTMVTIATI